MEEKKLTDEEIAKAILQQVEYNAGIPYIDEWLKVKTVKFADILNFIYRLQDKADGYERKIENGGLVSIDWHNEQVGHLEEENAELQKQVDELKAENGRLHKIIVKEMVSVKAVRAAKSCPTAMKMLVESVGCVQKDTAKEICEFILKYWQGHDLVECDWLRVAIAEKYGVEVE